MLNKFLTNSIYTIIKKQEKMMLFIRKLFRFITRFKIKSMGYKAKIQRVDRGVTKSFYINFPAAVAEACNVEKGEEVEWIIEDKNTFVLKRVNPIKSKIKK